MQPFPLRVYITVLVIRAVCVNTALLTVPWWPVYTREIWPTLLQAAVHVLLLAHAPRQSRLMRARWQASQVAAHDDAHEE